MLQFSLKELFLATTLIATGAAVLLWSIRIDQRGDWGWFAFGLWHLAGALVGGGTAVPIKRMWIGAAVGVLAQYLFLTQFLYKLG
jgi:hypothetical protein